MPRGWRLSVLDDAIRTVMSASPAWLAAYSGGAFSALINVPWMPGDPLSDVRVHMATTYAQHMAKTVEGDPAVMLSLAEGLAASLRGEDPEPTVMKSHAGSGS